jgi:hypothetical protein
VVHAHNPSTWKTVAGGLRVHQEFKASLLHTEALSQGEKKKISQSGASGSCMESWLLGSLRLGGSRFKDSLGK